MGKAGSFVVQLKNANSEDHHLFGKKGAEIAGLAELGLNVMPGFIITTDTYRDFFQKNNLYQKITHLLKLEEISIASKHIEKHILDGEFPEDIVESIFKAYRGLGSMWKDEKVVVSSQHKQREANGEAILIQSIKELWAQHFDPKNFRSPKPVAVIVSQKLKSQKSGYILLNDIKSKDDRVRILTDKKTEKYLTEKEEQELLLAGQKIAKAHYFPKKIKWEIANKKIYFTEIDHGLVPQMQASVKNITDVLKGTLHMGGIATGNVGKEIIIAANIDYDGINRIKTAKGLVIDSNLKNEHLRIILQRMGLPVVVGTKNALSSFRDGMVITVNGTNGQVYKGDFQAWQR